MSLEIYLPGIGITFDWPVMNGAGTCKTKEEETYLAKSTVAAINFGSITIPQREGNTGKTFWADDFFTMNSIGLRNLGMKGYDKELPEMVKIAHEVGKSFWLSVAGFSPEEYAILSLFGFQRGVDVVELDVACPNVWKEGIQEQIACLNPFLLEEILECVEEAVGSDAKVVVKLSYLDSSRIKEIAKVISKAKVVKGVVAINTIPDCQSYDEKGRSRIDVGNGLAGLSGPAIKPIALGQVCQLRKLLPPTIDTVGAGGISYETFGKDVIDFKKAGAPVVQITSILLQPARCDPKTWPATFATLSGRYIEELEKQGLPY